MREYLSEPHKYKVCARMPKPKRMNEYAWSRLLISILCDFMYVQIEFRINNAIRSRCGTQIQTRNIHKTSVNIQYGILDCFFIAFDLKKKIKRK